MTKKMTCPDTRQLARLIDNKLSKQEQEQLTGHLDHCASCQNKLQHWVFSDSSWQTYSAQLQDAALGSPQEIAFLEILRGARCRGKPPLNQNASSQQPTAKRLDHLSENADPVAAREVVAQYHTPPPPIVSPTNRPQTEAMGHSPNAKSETEDRTQLHTMPARYQFDGEIARGGMGAVYQGRDVEIGRDIAVKVMLRAHRDKPEFQHRFFQEAQIAGQLQHPGIVPVYDIGRSADALPFFTMKLVRGRTLGALLRQRQSVADEALRFLGIFEQICQTMAYAHAHGVIHRDLKPANIMIGSFGEVQVMDWGLAKVITYNVEEPAVAEGRTHESIVTAPGYQTDKNENSVSEPVPQTQAGQVLGTPAYMPPEQANGYVDDLDQRCDVFGLGAILCEILTGQAPYTGDSDSEIFRQARLGDLVWVRSRLADCGAEQSLIELALRSLAPEKTERPGDAGEVANAVTNYLESLQARLRQAEFDKARAKIKIRAERNSRRWQLGLAITLFLLIAVAAIASFRDWQQQSLQVQRRIRVTEATDNAIHHVYQLIDKELFVEAGEALRQNKQRLESRDRALRQQLDVVQRDLELAQSLDSARRRRVGEFVGAKRSIDQEYAGIFAKFKILQAGESAKTAAARIRASAIKPHLLTAVDEWAAAEKKPLRQQLLLHIARLVDPHPWRDEFRNSKTWNSANRLREVIARAKSKDVTPKLLGVIALRMRKVGLDPIPILKKAQVRFASDFWLNTYLATLFHARDPGRSVSYYRAALALRPQAVYICNNLADALALSGRLEESEMYARKVLALEPDNPKYLYNLGHILFTREQHEKASAIFLQVLSKDPNHVKAQSSLGNAWRKMGEEEKAMAAFRKTLTIEPDFVPAYINLGNGHLKRLEYKQAIANYREVLSRKPNYVIQRVALAQGLLYTGDFASADVALRRCLRELPPIHSLRSMLTDQLKLCSKLQQLQQKWGTKPHRQTHPTDARACLELAELCRYTNWYAASVRFYEAAVKKQPSLFADPTDRRLFDAAYTALLAVHQLGKDKDQTNDQQRNHYRMRAREWLRSDLQRRAAWVNVKNDSFVDKHVMEPLFHWKNDYVFRLTRHANSTQQLSAAERNAWKQFWSKVNRIRTDARGRRLTFALTSQKKSNAHVCRLKAGVKYIFDMMSQDFDPYLKILDKDGKVLAFVDDGGTGRNVRLEFIAPRTTVYQLVATSYQQQGTGDYTLVIRASESR